MHRVGAHGLPSDQVAALRPSLRGRSGGCSCMDSTGAEEKQRPGGGSTQPGAGSARSCLQLMFTKDEKQEIQSQKTKQQSTLCEKAKRKYFRLLSVFSVSTAQLCFCAKQPGTICEQMNVATPIKFYLQNRQLALDLSFADPCVKTKIQESCALGL